MYATLRNLHARLSYIGRFIKSDCDWLRWPCFPLNVSLGASSCFPNQNFKSHLLFPFFLLTHHQLCGFPSPFTCKPTTFSLDAMALGIVEPKRRPHEVASHVPGSSILFDEGRNLHSKHGSGKQAGLVLVPQPSNDPNDPLVSLSKKYSSRWHPPGAGASLTAPEPGPKNWPRWKKERCFWALMYGVIMGSVLSPILSTVGGPIVKEFGITFPQFALLSGWPLLTTGLSSCWSLLHCSIPWPLNLQRWAEEREGGMN